MNLRFKGASSVGLKHFRMKRIFFSERAILLAIFANALVIFFLNFPSYEHQPFLIGLDHFFVLFFVAEAIVKIRAWSWKRYWAAWWNRFDFIVLVFSLPSLMMGFLDIPDTSALLALRLFRMVRLLRFFRFVPRLPQLLEGLMRALKSSVFVIAVFSLITFLLSLFTCALFRDVAPEFFGNPVISAFSVFQLFTIEGWNEIPRLIAERWNDPMWAFFARLYFVFVVLSCGMFGMSFVTAIFVDEMTIDNNRELEQKIDELCSQIQRLERMLSDKS